MLDFFFGAIDDGRSTNMIRQITMPVLVQEVLIYAQFKSWKTKSEDKFVTLPGVQVAILICAFYFASCVAATVQVRRGESVATFLSWLCETWNVLNPSAEWMEKFNQSEHSASEGVE